MDSRRYCGYFGFENLSRRTAFTVEGRSCFFWGKRESIRENILFFIILLDILSIAQYKKAI